MDEKLFDAGADPEEVAAKLGLKVVQWLGKTLYARDENTLYSIGVRDSGVPAAPRLVVSPEEARTAYVGEEFQTPREAAVHAGLTVIAEASGGNVYALDGFGRKFLVQKTGNGPQAIHHDWATEEELGKFTPRHRAPKPTTT